MKRIKKIVVATDSSPLSLIALQRGLEIAKQYQAQVIVLHVLEKNGIFERLAKKVLPPARKNLVKSSEYIRQSLEEIIKKKNRRAKEYFYKQKVFSV